MRFHLSASQYFFSSSLLFIVVLLSFPASASTEVRVFKKDDQNYLYAYGLLRKALDKSPGKYRLVEVELKGQTTTEERDIENILNGTLSVGWFGASAELEQRMLPIRFPIFKGLLGYRLLMIRRGEQFRFDKINDAAGLSALSLGQGRFWIDSKILKSNGLSVVDVTKYEGIFHMLDGGRFDAFPTGIHEAWGELKAFENLSLDVEQRLVLHYPLPVYFYVSPQNTILANDLRVGLFSLLESGEFDAYLKSSAIFVEAVKNSDLKNRVIIELDNPFLPMHTPLDDPRLWITKEDF